MEQEQKLVLRTEPVALEQLRALMSGAGFAASIIVPWNRIDTSCGRGVIRENESWVMWCDDGTIINVSMLTQGGAMLGSCISHGDSLPGTYEYFSGNYPEDMTKGQYPGLERIFHERFRQVNEERWHPEHDDGHTRGQLWEAGMWYYRHATESTTKGFRWPFDDRWCKPSEDDPARDLEKAGALLQAECDRLHRYLQRCKHEGAKERLLVGIMDRVASVATMRDQVAEELDSDAGVLEPA